MKCSYRIKGPVVAVLVATVAMAAEVQAQTEEGFSWRVGRTWQYDDNLFRLPLGVTPQLVLGTPDAGETVAITTVGLRYNQRFGLQRVDLDVAFVDYNYQRYNNLDLTATNYNARWNWFVTPRIHGLVRVENNQVVNGFGDGANANAGNERLQRVTAWDAEYEIDGVWRVLGGIAHTRNTNQQPQRGEDSYITRTADVGVRYDALSGNSATLRWRQGNGRNPDPAPVGVNLRDDSYDVSELSLNVRWRPTGQMGVNLDLAQRAQTYTRTPVRNYSEPVAAMGIDWALTGKTSLTARWSTDVSSFQSNNASYSRSYRTDLALNHRVAARTTVLVSVGQTDRRYKQPLPGQVADPLQDQTRDVGVTARWSVTPKVQLDTSLRRTSRRANQAGLAFDSTAFQVGLTGAF
jgi:exopolysaccharide biosynthesis operon protein EpsL